MNIFLWVLVLYLGLRVLGMVVAAIFGLAVGGAGGRTYTGADDEAMPKIETYDGIEFGSVMHTDIFGD